MRGFYSAGFTKKPFYINLVSTIILIISTYLLVIGFSSSEAFRLFVSSLLKVEDLPGNAVLMLPLGFSIGTFVNCLILWLSFEFEFKGFSKAVMRSFFQGLGASIVMALVAYLGLNYFDSVFNLETLPGIFMQGFLSGIMAIISGVGILALLKSQELKQIWSVFKGRFWKIKVIATDPEIV